MVASGVRPTARIRNIIDMVAWEVLLRSFDYRSVTMMSRDEKKQHLRGIYCDLSQNPRFASYTNVEGVTGCLCTSTILYSFHKDRICLPFELALFQGHRRGIKFPSNMKSNSIKELCGEGMNLPCLATVIWALYLVRGFP